MFCPHCGAQNENGSKFCTYCGGALEAQPEPQQDSRYQQYQQTYQQPEQPYQFNQTAGGLLAPIRNRNILVCILLTFVTCGIYGLVWYVSLVNDLNTAAETPADLSGGLVVLLTLVTCGIYGFIWMYRAGEKVSAIKLRNTGASDSSAPILYLLLAIFGLSIVNYALIQNELNQVAEF